MKAFYIMIYIIQLYCCKIIVKNSENNKTVAIMHDAEADFGGSFEDGTVAYIIESYPILACEDKIFPPAYSLNNSYIIFVSLIRRGNCTFAHKVKAAQNSGYQGVIIYNNRGDGILNMKQSDHSDNNPIVIPSRMVGRTSGYLLRKYNFTLSRHQFILIFYNNYDFSPQFYIIAFLAFVSIGFLIIGVGFAVKMCRDLIKRRANRLKKSHLKKIPVKKFVKGVDTFDMCAICLEDFSDGDKLRILSCNHAYHMKCIDPWLLKQKRNCPVCKSRVKIPGREEESDDNISVTISPDPNPIIADEHTPLINGTSQFYFGNAEIDAPSIQKQSESNTHNCYDNPSLECHDGNSSLNTHTTIVAPSMSINNQNDTSSSAHSCDLTKIV